MHGMDLVQLGLVIMRVGIDQVGIDQAGIDPVGMAYLTMADLSVHDTDEMLVMKWKWTIKLEITILDFIQTLECSKKFLIF